jgi:hypothetical protein
MSKTIQELINEIDQVLADSLQRSDDRQTEWFLSGKQQEADRAQNWADFWLNEIRAGVVIASETPEINGKRGYIKEFYPESGYALVKCGSQDIYAYYDELQVDQNVFTYTINKYRSLLGI